MTIKSKIAENPKRPTEQDTTSSQIDDQQNPKLLWFRDLKNHVLMSVV